MYWHEWRQDVPFEVQLKYEAARLYAASVNAPTEEARHALRTYATFFKSLLDESETPEDVGKCVDSMLLIVSRFASIDKLERSVSRSRAHQYQALGQIRYGISIGLKGMHLLAKEFGLRHF